MRSAAENRLRKSKLKAASEADRLNKWQAYFQKLLGNTPNVSV